jgi:hypothetical protein
MKRYTKRCKRTYLSAGEQDLKWYERLGKAFTDEDSAFNFPIKYPAIDLDKSTKNTLLYTAGIFAGGMILAAFIFKMKK